MTRERKLEDMRPKRVPIHEQRRDIMNAPRKTGFVRRWVNMIGDRVERMKLAGYNIVEESVPVGDPSVTGNNQSLGTGARKGVGGGVQAVLMEIPKELYDEDQKAKIQNLAEKEAQLRKSLNSGNEGTYGKVEFTSTK